LRGKEIAFEFIDIQVKNVVSCRPKTPVYRERSVNATLDVHGILEGGSNTSPWGEKAMKRKGPARDLKKELYWREILREHRESGLNIREFCRKKGLTEPLFYAWRREVKRRGRLRIRKRTRFTSAKLVRPNSSKAAKPRSNGAGFVPIKLSGGIGISCGFEAVECVLPTGTVLRCPADMGPAAIVAIVRAWEEGRC
jgi:hypothetical protein